MNLELISFSSILMSVMLLGFFYFILTYVINPYFKVKFYVKQGGYSYYRLGIGFIGIILENIKKHKDAFWWAKNLVKQNPDIRFFAANSKSKAFVGLIDPELIKEFCQKQEHEYVKNPINVALFKGFADSGLVMAGGETWKKHRKL